MTLRNLVAPAPSGKVSPARGFGQGTATDSCNVVVTNIAPAHAAAAADRTGLFNCRYTGVALEKLLARGEIRGTERIVVVSTANGPRFTD